MSRATSPAIQAWSCPTCGRDVALAEAACPGCGYLQVFVPEPLAPRREPESGRWLLPLLAAGGLVAIWILL
jgi:hypothetical protein